MSYTRECIGINLREKIYLFSVTVVKLSAITLRLEHPKCINCGGPHTANFSACPKLVEYVARTKKFKTSASPRNFEKPQSYNINSQTNFPSLPQNLRPNPWTRMESSNSQNLNKINSTNIQNSDDDFSTLMKEISTLNQICDLKKMIHAVRALNIKLRNATDGVSKLQAFVECAAILDD